MTLFNPGSLQQVAICLYNKSDFFQQNFSQIPFLNLMGSRTQVSAASFDFTASPTLKNIKTFASDPKNYIFGACENFKIEKIPYYKPVSTFTYSDFIAQPTSNTLKTAGSISVPVVLPFNKNVAFSKFLECLWRISIYTFSPFFFYTSVKPINLGGPLFAKNFNISVNENSPVKINMSFEGGTYTIVSAQKTFPPQNINTIFPFPANYQPGDENFTYRTAKNYDCFFLIPNNKSLFSTDDIYNSYSNQEGFFSNQNSINIMSMSLSVDQKLEIVHTAVDGISKNIYNGPKHIGLKKRSVTGSVTFSSTTDLTLMYSGNKIQQFVMYFGGPFYYPMNNVNVQQFEMTLNGNEFIHTIEFIALLQESIFADFYKQNEFDIFSDHFIDPITGEVFTKPQA
jgi:hypothetical protein